MHCAPLLIGLVLLLAGCSGGGANYSSEAPGPTDPTDIDPDDVTTIDTRGGSQKKLLSFSTSGKHEFGRYLSEYILIIKSDKESCVRLKVRPADEIGTPVKTDYFGNDDPGAGSCGSSGGAGAELALSPPSPKKPVQAAVARPMRDEHRHYLTTLDPDAGRLGVTSSPELCSISIFRMLAKRLRHDHGETTGSEYTVTKTGRLLAVSAKKKVRIWLDEEYFNPANICSALGQAPLDNFKKIEFPGQITTTIFDRLYMAHLHNLASEVEKSYERLSAAFGDVSDVDENGSVDIFMSPDVNRQHFNGIPSDKIDDFHATLPYRPNDLAPFDSRRNPTSNEGEIIYMWVPDPAGIYTYGFRSSSNSLTSNYSKGYIAAQLMNLIILNHKTIVDKRLKKEKRWLMEALSLLASSYIGGNNYVFQSLAQYLTARPQTINIFATPRDAHTLNIDDQEREGMLTMFGWYMHTRLCGKKVEICAKLKSLVDSELTGEKNIENTFGVSLDQLLIDFGITVAAQLTDDPKQVRALWDKKLAETEKLAKPIEMPLFDLENPATTEVSPKDPPLTVEVANDGVKFLSGDPATASQQAWDRAYASPFPNLSNILYQVVLPDSDMDLKITANSVTFVIVTGLTATRTDIIANFGKGLQVVVMPLGDRNSDLRKIHQEKRSETGHMDVRPTNLTDTIDTAAKHTYYDEQPYPQSSMGEWTLQLGRELWLAGTIDNIALNPMTVGDADTYVIKADPLCGSRSCTEKEQYYVLVQTKVRDFPSQLIPFTVATTTELSLFKGRNIWGKVADLAIPDFETGSGEVPVLCQDSGSYTCANGGIADAETFDVRHQPGGGYALAVDNFLFSNRAFADAQRFNNGVLQNCARGGFRSFCPEEAARQFFNFKWINGSSAQTYAFYAVDTSANLSTQLETLSNEYIDNLQKFKRLLKHAPFDEEDDANEQEKKADEEGREVCVEIGLSEENDCRTKNETGLVARVKELLTKKRFVCDRDSRGDCDEIRTAVGSWFPSKPKLHFFDIKKTSKRWKTYYDPVFAKGGRGACAGETAKQSDDFPCDLDATMRGGDIRHQLNADANQVICNESRKFGDDYSVCIDPITINHASGGEDRYDFFYFNPATARARERCPFPLDSTFGEIVGKSDRLHYMLLAIDKENPTFINLMVGGLNQSQGRYLLRVNMLRSLGEDPCPAPAN